MTKIKICGLTKMEDIEIVNQYRPDYVGFVFAESKRKISAEQAKVLVQHLHPAIRSVGVFQNEQKEKVVKIANEVGLDALQLHGEETEADICYLKTQLSAMVWKAIRVTDESALNALATCSAHHILLDASHGGSGKPFCWDFLNGIDTQNIILAGGISESNVQEAIRRFSPYMVDLSSGVETDGKKDGIKIKRMIEIIRGDNNE